MTWSLTDAENRLSEILALADVEAQLIVRRDREYVLLPADRYRELRAAKPTFTDFLIDAGPRSDGIDVMPRPSVSMRDPQL